MSRALDGRTTTREPTAPPFAVADGASALYRSGSVARLAAAAALAELHRTVLSESEVAEILDPDDTGALAPAFQGPCVPGGGLGARRARSERFRAEGSIVSTVVLRPVAGLLRCFGITGSTAYGAPVEGDDLDFLAVVRRGGVWPFLLYAWLASRFRRVATPDGPRAWCFNLVLDERAAQREFARPRGFLVARDALMLQPLLGAPYYRALLAASTWLQREIPVLYGKRAAPSSGGMPADEPAPVAVRALNLILFPWMATYLQLVALYESARYRASGQDGRAFRVATTPARLSIYTEEFERLERTWRAAAASALPARR
jgi:hypothetical protein